MQTLTLIGIGMGNPDHLTLAGIQAMQSVDIVLLPRKGAAKDDLADLRRAILAAHAPEVGIAEFTMPKRDVSSGYRQGVDCWHDEIAEAWSKALPNKARNVGLLVWGDPSLYDSTIRISERFDPKPEVKVVPGITALQILTAAFAIPLNEINAPVLVTTGRQLRDHGWPEGVGRAAVMLDGECSFQSLDADGFEVWWGAFLGMPNQILISGELAKVKDRIVETRTRARETHGWIMDTYLLAKAEK